MVSETLILNYMRNDYRRTLDVLEERYPIQKRNRVNHENELATTRLGRIVKPVRSKGNVTYLEKGYYVLVWDDELDGEKRYSVWNSRGCNLETRCVVSPEVVELVS